MLALILTLAGLATAEPPDSACPLVNPRVVESSVAFLLGAPPGPKRLERLDVLLSTACNPIADLKALDAAHHALAPMVDLTNDDILKQFVAVQLLNLADPLTNLANPLTRQTRPFEAPAAVGLVTVRWSTGSQIQEHERVSAFPGPFDPLSEPHPLYAEMRACRPGLSQAMMHLSDASSDDDYGFPTMMVLFIGSEAATRPALRRLEQQMLQGTFPDPVDHGGTYYWAMSRNDVSRQVEERIHRINELLAEHAGVPHGTISQLAKHETRSARPVTSYSSVGHTSWVRYDGPGGHYTIPMTTGFSESTYWCE